jgi:hypothetical protein
MTALLSAAIVLAGGVFGAQAALPAPNSALQSQGTARLARLAASDPVTSTTSTTSTTTTTTTAPPAPAQAGAPAPTSAPAATTPAATPAPPTPVPASTPAVPAIGQATAWGCTAALAYLQTYAAPGFAFACPGYAEGHEAMTCVHDTPQYPDACPNGPTIAIADACPQAYMNESANSWYLTDQVATEQARFGASYAWIDPFGACP